MIHQPDYVKSLLEKYMRGTASSEEVRLLMIAWDLYDDDELVDMMADIDTGMPDPKELDSEEWNHIQLSFKEKFRQRLQGKTGWSFSMIGTVAASFVLLTLTVYYISYSGWNKNNFGASSCDGLPGNTDIPTSSSHCTLWLGEKQTIEVDSTTQGMIRQWDNLDIMQSEPGILIFKSRPLSLSADTEKNTGLIITTPPAEQYLLVLFDRLQVRLNAMTKVRVSASYLPGVPVLEVLDGEVFVESIGKASTPVIITTQNALLSTKSGDVNVRVFPGATVAALKSGDMEVKDSSGNHREAKGCDVAVLWQIRRKDGAVYDSLRIDKNVDIYQMTRWTRVNRVYHNVWLKEFVVDMGRWYGLKFEKLDCLPDKTISVQVCYKAPLKEMFAAIENNGVHVYRVGDILTFCDPGHKRGTSATASITHNK